MLLFLSIFSLDIFAFCTLHNALFGDFLDGFLGLSCQLWQSWQLWRPMVRTLKLGCHARTWKRLLHTLRIPVFFFFFFISHLFQIDGAVGNVYLAQLAMHLFAVSSIIPSKYRHGG